MKPHYITPKERLGYFLLVVSILVGHSLYFIYDRFYGVDQEGQTMIIQEIMNHGAGRDGFNQKLKIPAEQILQPFNPNTVHKDSLEKFGFSKYSINNLVKYRQAGGTIKNEKDLLKIYGIDTSILSDIRHLLVYPLTKPSSFNVGKIKSNKTVIEENDTTSNKSVEIKTNIKKKTEFDPNTASLDTLLSLGFSKYAANNLIKYRSKGGSIYESSDLLKIYGIDTLLVQDLKEYVVIKKEKQTTITKPKDSLGTFPFELETNTIDTVIFDINIVSQEELISIKGIGPVISKNIIAYRSQLGGFYEINQINEVYGISKELFEATKDRFTILHPPEKVYIPSLTFKEVLKHPYTDYESTKLLKNISILDFEEKIKVLIKGRSLDERLIPYLLLTDPLNLQIEKDE